MINLNYKEKLPAELIFVFNTSQYLSRQTVHLTLPTSEVLASKIHLRLRLHTQARTFRLMVVVLLL